MATLSDRKLLHIAASQSAAKAVRSKDFAVVQHGSRMSDKEALSRGFVIASWWDEHKTLICTRYGKLLLVTGKIALEVTAHPDVLRKAFKPHYDRKWWLACH